MSSKMFSFCISYIVCIVFLVVNCSGEALNETLKLGSVDGKAYFADENHRTWTQSRDYCVGLGMRIATITSGAQADFLKSVYDPILFDGWYWLGARDVNHDGKFQWSNNMDEVQTFENIRWMETSGGDNKHCLTFSSNNHASSYYFKRSCHHSYYTLCETDQSQEMNELLPHINQLKSEFQEFIYFGTFGDKAYFGDKILRSWRESNSFCERKGLKIAAVTITARINFFKSACRKINNDGWFWVAGNGVEDGNENRHCSCYSPHDNIYFQRVCYSKHFTICEGLGSNVTLKTTLKMENLSTTTKDFSEIGEGSSTEKNNTEEADNSIGTDGKDLSYLNGTVYLISPEIEKESYSKTVFIVGIFILILIIIGLLIRQTKIWNRNLNSSHYLPVVEYFRYDDVANDLPGDNKKSGMNEKQ